MKNKLTFQEVLWAIFFTVVLGTILGSFIYLGPAVLIFGLEPTAVTGFYCSLGGMVTYWIAALVYNKFKK